MDEQTFPPLPLSIPSLSVIKRKVGGSRVVWRERWTVVSGQSRPRRRRETPLVVNTRRRGARPGPLRRGTAQASPMGLVECPELRGGSDTHAGGKASEGPTEERGADPEDPRKGEKAARGRVTKDGVSLCGRGPSTVSRVITPREGTQSPGGSGQRRTRPSLFGGRRRPGGERGAGFSEGPGLDGRASGARRGRGLASGESLQRLVPVPSSTEREHTRVPRALNQHALGLCHGHCHQSEQCRRQYFQASPGDTMAKGVAEAGLA